MSFDVLFVCTGNICRSPMGERLMLARVGSASPRLIRTRSAGTHAVVGHPMDTPSAGVLRELGGDPMAHVAQQLTRELIRRANLILTATTEQRSAVVRSEPKAMRRAFTMREFARLGAELPVLGPRPGGRWFTARVADVAAQRGLHEPGEPGSDEIGDPYGAPLATVQRCGLQIEDAVAGIIRALGLPGQQLTTPLDAASHRAAGPR